MTFKELHDKILSLPDVDIYPIGSPGTVKSHWWADRQKEIIDLNSGKDMKRMAECKIAKYRLINILEQLK